MGKDKASIEYHGLPQWQYCIKLLQPFCKSVYVSCLESQRINLGIDVAIVDEVMDQGPAGGLWTAFKRFPEKAWFILACDYPLVMTEHLVPLISARDITIDAISYKNPEDGLPEPLLSIWEPKLCDWFINQKPLASPRKALIANHCKLIEVVDRQILMNVNTEFLGVKSMKWPKPTGEKFPIA